MIVEIDDKSGFCFGVVNAISRAEESLAAGGTVYSLGDIVHNRVEVARLREIGLHRIGHGELKELKNARLLIRAHGEPPATYRIARDNGLTVIDATCPVVARLQKKVIAAYQKMSASNGQVVILGRKGHAEVVGLAGQVDGNVIVVEKPDDLNTIDFSRPVYMLSQTTQSLDLFRTVRDEILRRAESPDNVTIYDTICRQVSGREKHLAGFASRFDVVIFVSGRKSSNGKILYGVCSRVNARSYLVEDETELDPEWFLGAGSTGVCGATSTPKWLMARVAEKIKTLIPETGKKYDNG